MLNKKKFAAYNHFMNDVNQRVRDINWLLTNNETKYKKWSYVEFKIEPKNVVITFKYYIGCGDYEYEDVLITIDEFTSENYREIIVEKFKL